MAKKVFISHAVADADLVRKFVDMLRLGVDIPKEQIFCMSLQGMGIPGGTNFVSFIRDELRECKFVISILTPSYYESQFCMSELGATWILDGIEFFPILVPPLNYGHLKAVLTGVQSGSIIDKDFLSQLHDRLRLALQLGASDTSNWEVNRDAFINGFSTLVIKGFSSVPFSEVEKVEKKYEMAQKSLQAKNGEIDQLMKQIAELEKCKDAQEVKQVKQKYDTEQENLDALADKFKEVRLPRIVIEALYYEQRGQRWCPKKGFDYNHIWEPAEYAETNGFLEIDENEISANLSHPPVKRAKQALRHIQNFISHTSREFDDNFEQEHDYQLTLDNRQFWVDFLGL